MTTPQPPRNLHAPLRRVLPEKQSSGVQNVVIQQQQQHISSHPLLFNLKSNDTTTSVDSSYSSDHSTLSRETSDSSNTSSSSKEFFEKNFLEELSSVPPSSLSEEKEINDSLLEFAIRLGFDKQQLKIVLNKLNKNGQKEEDDKVLLELIKLGGRRKEEELIENNCNNYLKLLRPIVIDGSNIAMTHGNKAFFSCRGIRECVNYFTERGHTDILVFVPQFRREQSRSDSPIIDQHILNELEKEGKLIWTPSRRIGGRRIVCHDDRYILKTASEKQAVIVSNDEYRDLVKENPRWRSVVENYLLMYSFVDGKFMPPDDPLGRQGPNLDQLLTFGHSSINSQPCPYAKKCTYGNKCKYFHPERPNGVRIGAVDKLIGNNLNKKQYLTARPSLVAESVSSSSSPYLSPPPSHTNVGRTKSLNLTEMSKFNGEINLNPLSLQQNTSTTTKEINQNQNNFSHMFAPSTSIWGSCEFSLSPKTATNLLKEEINNNNLEKQRQHLQYHLSQLFPEATVFAVMAAHPQEMDAQILCQRIIAFQKGFQKEIEK